MITMITPKQDLYMNGTEDCFAKKGDWYLTKEQDKFGDFMFIDELKQEHYYDEEDLDKKFHTIDFEKGFEFTRYGSNFRYKEGDVFLKGCYLKTDTVSGEKVIDLIKNGLWEITRYSNEPSKEENHSDKFGEAWGEFLAKKQVADILASFPVPEDSIKKDIYEESLDSLKAHLVSLTSEEFLFEFNKYNKPYNPVKNISREKYYRCAKRNPNICEQFNSDQGILFMSGSVCGKYYYWEGYDSKNDIIYSRGEKSWVEDNFENRKHFEYVSAFEKKITDYVETNNLSMRVPELLISDSPVTRNVLKSKKESDPSPIKSDGGKSDYYKIFLPEWLLEKHSEKGFIMLEDLAEVIFKNDFNFTNVFKAQKRMFELKEGGGKEGNDFNYDATKCKYYIDKQVEVEGRKL